MLEILALYCISYIIIGIGFLLNGFIVIANLFWWMKGQTVHTINVLITGLGLVRILLLGESTLKLSLSISELSIYSIDAHPEYIDTSIVCIMSCNLWWNSVLCVFYCVKITNYSNRLFIRLKMNISKMVPWMLLISLVISFLSCLPCRWLIFSIRSVNGTNYESGAMEVSFFNLFIIAFAGSIIPFMIFCAAIHLIIVSLLRHTRNMSSRGSGFSDAQRDIHISVIRSMVSFLLFYALYFVAYIVFTIAVHFKVPTINLICFICICCYPSLHPISLIFSNKELKHCICVVLSCTCLENVKSLILD